MNLHQKARRAGGAGKNDEENTFMKKPLTGNLGKWVIIYRSLVLTLSAFSSLSIFCVMLNGCTTVQVSQDSITVNRLEESVHDFSSCLSFFFAKYGQIPVCIWFFVWFVLILSLAFACWKAIDVWDPPRKTRDQDIDFKALGLEQIRIAKYKLVSDEVTRYRNLEWQIGVYAWGVYYGVSLFKEKHPYFPDTMFVPIVFLTAVSATLFLIFCENTANRNREQRRELEIILGLDAAWRFTEGATLLSRPGFLVSMAIFLFAIWAPALIMTFFRN